MKMMDDRQFHDYVPIHEYSFSYFYCKDNQV